MSRSIPLVPVLVGGASMPTSNELPNSLKELVYRHGTSVRSGPQFRPDMDVLIRALRRYVTVEG